MEEQKVGLIWGITRIAMGLLFLWAFFDKVFGLGFATAKGKALVDGASPVYGFLKFATKGPLAEFYQSLATSPVVLWLFMLGLLFIGLTLTFGFMVKLGGWAGALMVILMYTAVMPPENHPFLDDHIIYALLLVGLGQIKSGRSLGLGQWWSGRVFVQKYPILE